MRTISITKIYHEAMPIWDISISINIYEDNMRIIDSIDIVDEEGLSIVALITHSTIVEYESKTIILDSKEIHEEFI